MLEGVEEYEGSLSEDKKKKNVVTTGNRLGKLVYLDQVREKLTQQDNVDSRFADVFKDILANITLVFQIGKLYITFKLIVVLPVAV